tara:strand:+ start:5525 stop:6748 length:1224 start_codon:yes stop_codon:yes gene_type:complete
MIYTLTASRDATIYEGSGASTGLSTKWMNTGGDEILERGKIISSSQTVNTYNSRMLLYFPIDWSVIGTASYWTTASDAYLNLFATEGAAIPRSHSLSIHPISKNWDVGIGRAGNRPKTTDGVSWVNYKGEDTTGQAWPIINAQLVAGETMSNGVTNTGGGSWWTSSVAVHEYNYNTNPNESLDMRVNVKNILSDWSQSTAIGSSGYPITNHGFLIKLSGSFGYGSSLANQTSFEHDKYKYGMIKYFSRNTHTIYPPKLEICWDDKVYNTGSLSVLDMTDPGNVFFYIKRNRGAYKRGSKIRFYTPGRAKYPTKTYGNTSANLAIKHVTESANICYSIIDVKTNETIIPHDNTYTHLSCHSTLGNYFEIHSDSLFEERDYRIQLRYRETTASVDYSYFDIKDTFKVVR